MEYKETASPRGQVFISYARSDAAGREWSARICRHVQSLGQSCWRDDESLIAGDSIARGVPEGLEQASALVLVVSRSVLGSDWVMGELDQAANLGLTIIPAIVEAGAALPVPLRLIKPVDFARDEKAAWTALETALGLAPAEQSGLRELELRYLEWLLARRAIEQNRVLYVELTASREGRTAQQRQDLDAQWLLQDFDHVCVGGQGRERQASHSPTPLQDIRQALRLSDDFVILGNPGAGKTFSLWRIAAELAEAAKGDSQAPLPVIVPLGQWIHPVRDGEDDALVRFVEQRAAFRNGESVLGPLRGRLEALLREGRLALLLDGLNELPTHQRKPKGQRIRALLSRPASHAGRLVVTCRAADFESEELRLPLDQVRVQPLRPVQIHRFLHRYLEFLDPDRGESDAEELFWRIAGGDSVRQLWSEWLQAGADWERFWSADPAPPPRRRWLDRILPWRRNRPMWWEREDRMRLERLDDPRSLLHLASNPYLLRMMTDLGRERGPEGLDGNRAEIFARFVDHLIRHEDEAHRRREGGVPHPAAGKAADRLGRLAWELQNRAGGPDKVQLAMDRADAQALIGDGALAFAHASSLLEVGDTVRFVHQLLQEYFAALGLQWRVGSGLLDAATLWPPALWWERTGWEEAAVFLAGLKQDDPSMVIDWLRDAQPLVLVQCLEESGCALPSAERLADLKARWLPRLDPAREPRPEGRHAVATALARLGLDDRPGVGLTSEGLPDIDWVEIPGVPYLYGEDKKERELPTFYMACYPVTNAQYQSFIDGGGYKEDRWWEGLERRMENPNNPRWRGPNRSREIVSWYEAMAFCRWLSERLSYEVRLPTEYEWEKAARGTDGREYP